MRGTRLSIGMAVIAAVGFATLLMTSMPVVAQTETVLHSFAGTDGISPVVSVVFDSAGNLYGVASQGGGSNNGTVFELTPNKNKWTEKTLLSFNGGAGGAMPLGGLIFDSAGNLYGTTKLGGANGVGTAFELIKSKSGAWSETVLHSFGSGKDGQYAVGNLNFDGAGNLYGSTQGGGAYSNATETSGGTVFKLAPKKGGGWTETVLHSFGNAKDGNSPRSNVILDKEGNLYGTTNAGGAYGSGTVYELSPKSGGGWTEKVLYSFDSKYAVNGDNNGYKPVAGLTLDTSGNLYGTTAYGGYYGGGVAYELSPKSGGSWTETVIYAFDFLNASEVGSTLYSGLVLDKEGNLYGTTLLGGDGTYFGNGTAFELKPPTKSGGTWSLDTLYVFQASDGTQPGTGYVTLDSDGSVYGGTQAGGANLDGVVFKITP
ncbi:MAG: choice-of-anchor tandem repeat GloVer-containing protein [Candidatus Sulfotelmatobacter sp.]